MRTNRRNMQNSPVGPAWCWLPWKQLDKRITERDRIFEMSPLNRQFNSSEYLMVGIYLTVVIRGRSGEHVCVHALQTFVILVCSHSAKVRGGVCCLDTTKQAAAEGFLTFALLPAG